jgi:hypothetical protein
VRAGKCERALIAVPIGADLELEHDSARRSRNHGERVRVAMRVDADDVVQLICKHASTSSLRLDRDRWPVWGGKPHAAGL